MPTLDKPEPNISHKATKPQRTALPFFVSGFPLGLALCEMCLLIVQRFHFGNHIPFSWQRLRWLWLCLLLAGCSVLGGQPPATAETGLITVYTTFDSADVDLYFQDFVLTFPQIEVNLVSVPSNEIVARMLAEKDDPQADVLWGVSLTNVLMIEWNDLLKPYTPVGLERLAPEFRDSRTPPYWVGDSIEIPAFCVNREAAALHNLPIPQSWQDLRNPVYQRGIVMSNPLSSSIGWTSLTSVFWQFLSEEDAWNYLDDLHQNIALYTSHGLSACKLVEQGTYALGIAKRDESLINVEMIYPSEGSSWELAVNALVRKEETSPAAKTFLDWAISNSAMQLYARKSAITALPTGLDIPPGYPADPNAQLLVKDFAWESANRNRILKEWDRRYSDKVQVSNETEHE